MYHNVLLINELRAQPAASKRKKIEAPPFLPYNSLVTAVLSQSDLSYSFTTRMGTRHHPPLAKLFN